MQVVIKIVLVPDCERMKIIQLFLLISIIACFITIGILLSQKTPIEYSAGLSKNLKLITSEYKLREITKCIDRNYEFEIEQRGNYFALFNFIKSSRNFACHESVTYTTQGDFHFLDNLPILVKKWMGPVSVAVFAPGTDFQSTLESIDYLRNCETPLIKEYVTFHIILLSEHFPQRKLDSRILDSFKDMHDCKKKPPYDTILTENSYKRKHNLTYPINIARNVARQTATTHFVLASDIELYPSQNFIPKFLEMILKNPEFQYKKNPRIYVLPIFEILEKEEVPENKTILQEMMKNGKAFLFHRNLCAACHAVPKFKEWVALQETEGLHVFTVGKRMKLNRFWEAFYVGTHEDPLFDERLTWEGQSNKMTQGYALCLLNYDYMVLDNAFLIHRPGIKKSKEQLKKFQKLVFQTNILIKKIIKEELHELYGTREGCYIS